MIDAAVRAAAAQLTGRMTAFLVRRLAFACVTLFAVLTLVFVLVRIVPGDPAQLILGDQASREAIEALRHRLGLDLPITRAVRACSSPARCAATGASRWSPVSR